MFNFDFPCPPSENQLYRNLPRIGRCKTKKYTDYESHIRWFFAKNPALKDNLACFVPNIDKIFIKMIFFFPYSDLIAKNGNHKKNDVLNRPKALIDILFKTIGVDDGKIYAAYVEKIPQHTLAHPYVNVTIKEHHAEGI